MTLNQIEAKQKRKSKTRSEDQISVIQKVDFFLFKRNNY